VKLGLNADGPYYRDLWDVYKMNTIIGLSAAGGFLVLVAAVYLLVRCFPGVFQWSVAPEEDPVISPDAMAMEDGKKGFGEEEKVGSSATELHSTKEQNGELGEKKENVVQENEGYVNNEQDTRI